ncbi:hypothetical protein [Bacillus nitratireducens]|uniref:hypothetical protein n=1 Tax=Bacillus nitratireducens TaxID=2026193 RepID=UPI00283D453A|nr:hypothetical protein [Bacillus nitratireducens]MDR4170361.1 hypothetical protein [Bacillus nitratireducens]
MMINRVIFNENTYYKVNDLQELYNVSMYKIKKAIKEQGIVIGTLKGFGRTLYILEAELNMLEIDGAVTYMKTVVKDYRETLTINAKAASWAYAFTGVKISNEELLQKVNDKAIDEMSAFDEHTIDERDTEKTEFVERFNDVAEQYGYSDRLHRVDLLINGEILNVEFYTAGDEIGSANNYLDITHCVHPDDFERAFQDGCIDEISVDGVEHAFTKGVSYLTCEEAFAKLLEKVYEKHSKMEWDGYMEDENGMLFATFTRDKEANIVIALLKGNYKIVNRARQF